RAVAAAARRQTGGAPLFPLGRKVCLAGIWHERVCPPARAACLRTLFHTAVLPGRPPVPGQMAKPTCHGAFRNRRTAGAILNRGETVLRRRILHPGHLLVRSVVHATKNAETRSPARSSRWRRRLVFLPGFFCAGRSVRFPCGQATQAQETLVSHRV